ncbi:MAG TPA: ATP-binding protein [Gemmataceae bacterium]|nr:ATP-binding protein [Gemmataceae bacterium]
MFRSVSLRNFKSLANVRVDLGPFTVLVGANGSGKSSFLQAIELFSWAVRHESINDSLLNHNVDFRDLVYLRSSKARITFDADLEFPKEGIELACERVHVWMRLAKKRYVYLTEHVRPGDAPPKNVTDWAYGVVSRKRYQRAWEANGPAIEHRNVALGHSMLGDIYSAEGSRQKFPILRKVADHFMNYVHYEIWGPEKLRDPSLHPVSSRRNGARGVRLGKSGEDLPRLLWSIHSVQSRWVTLLDELRIGFPAIREIRFQKGLDGELGLWFGEKRKGASSFLRYRPSQVSDGFLRLLGLLAIKHQPYPLELLGYEEPENGLHPSALDECMRHLKDIARNGTQVIVTTHSPYLLNYLLEDKAEPKAELRLVIRGEDGKTIISKPDPAKLKKARAQGFGIGELWGMLLNEKALAQS